MGASDDANKGDKNKMDGYPPISYRKSEFFGLGVGCVGLGCSFKRFERNALLIPSIGIFGIESDGLIASMDGFIVITQSN
jgi:hypothetical protein